MCVILLQRKKGRASLTHLGQIMDRWSVDLFPLHDLDISSADPFSVLHDPVARGAAKVGAVQFAPASTMSPGLDIYYACRSCTTSYNGRWWFPVDDLNHDLHHDYIMIYICPKPSVFRFRHIHRQRKLYAACINKICQNARFCARCRTTRASGLRSVL